MASSGWKYVLKQIGLIVLVILLALLFLAVGLMLG
ncbi:TPA: DNA-directed RNA polymerase subunit beta, partial [Streptococcus agalactiae]|nr:DNA-directed RNA polymerase subunit beta [Streptococcus agalactiae]